MLWTPEVLRGSQPGNGYSWGNPPEPSWNTFIDRVMMQLGDEDYLDTHDCFWVSGNTGITHDGNMNKGYTFIRSELNCHTEGVSYELPNELQKVYDCIVLDERPVLIKTPNHFSVAAGFWYHVDGDNHYMLLKTGWSGTDKWIKTEYLERYWYVRNLIPNSKIVPGSYYWTSTSPSICTTPWYSDHYDNLWYFWLDGSSQNIHYISGADGAIPDFATSASLFNVRALYAPAVFSEARIQGNNSSGRIYLLYVDEEHSMHLLSWEGPEKKWQSLVFPSDLKTYVQPSICGTQGNWLSVALYDDENNTQIISTCKDVQRSGAWPTEILTQEYNQYWTFFSFSRTNHSLNLFPYNNKYILLYIYDQDIYNRYPVICIMNPDGSSKEFVNFEFSHRIIGAPSIVYSNETLLAAYRSTGNRIVIDKLSIIPAHIAGRYDGREWEVAASVSAKEVAYLTETSRNDPALGMIDREDGKHPTLVLSWNNLDNGQLNVRLLSIDLPEAALNYIDKPY